MVEYAALVLGSVAMMFFLFELGLNLSTPGFIDKGVFDLMDFIKIAFLLAGFGMGFFTMGLMQGIAAENGASQGFKDAVAVGWFIWGSFFTIFILGMTIYFFWWVPKKAQEAFKQGQRSDRES